MKSYLLAAALLVSTRAHADDTKRTIFGDSAAVGTVRPIALTGALERLGPAWANAVRGAMKLPSSVNPFDPAVLQLTGIDPAGELSFGVRALRGGLHVRVSVPLADPHVADALLHTLASAAGATLERSGAAWTAKSSDGTPIVARLEGTLLVADVVLANATMKPTPADVLHVVPLKPPRAFAGTRGLQKRMTADDAIALWGDLDALAKLGLQREEADLSAALKGVDPKLRAQLVKQGQAELAQCKQELGSVPRTFDDVLVAVHVTSPDKLRIELAEGGRKAALDALRTARAVPTRSLGECGDANLCATVSGLPSPKPRALAPQMKCSKSTALSEAASSWPALLASLKDTETFAKVLRGGRGLFFSIPAGEENPVRSKRFTLVAELDPAVRGELDKLISETRYGAASPLRVEGRSITTYGAPYEASTSPIVAVDTQDTATVVASGLRELLGPALSRVKPAPPAVSPTVATLTINSRGLRQADRAFGNDTHVLDGVDQLDAQLVLEEDVLRLDADLTLKPAR